MRNAGTPWTTAQARLVVACDVLAAALIVTCAAVANGKDSLDAQIVWIDISLVALIVAVTVNGFLFLLARRAIGQRLRRLGQ